MISIVPTILTPDPARYQQMQAVYGQFAKRLQLDICDGEFVPTQTIGLEDLQPAQGINLDLHMMVIRPSEHMEAILALKPSLVIFHAECGENLLSAFEQLKAAGIKTGVAMVKTTFPGTIKPYIDVVDHVLIFAGTLGQQGSDADMLQTEKVKLIRNLSPNVEIGWDGGVNLKNIRALGHADLDVLNVGSALSTSQNPAETFQQLTTEADLPGVVI